MVCVMQRGWRGGIVAHEVRRGMERGIGGSADDEDSKREWRGQLAGGIFEGQARRYLLRRREDVNFVVFRDSRAAYLDILGEGG